MAVGKLYLIPSPIADGTHQEVIPRHVLAVLPEIKYFLAENVRTARRYLSSLKIFSSIEALHFEVLDKETTRESIKTLFTPISEGFNMGVLSESGCPGIADPGALAVEYAHRNGIEVVPLTGPSSIILALMASGLNGQRFAFHGYLPVDQHELSRTLKERERESAKMGQTQIFIETPYRNNSLIKNILAVLAHDTLLTIASDITGEGQDIKTYTVRQWIDKRPELGKIPTVYLFLAARRK